MRRQKPSPNLSKESLTELLTSKRRNSKDVKKNLTPAPERGRTKLERHPPLPSWIGRVWWSPLHGRLGHWDAQANTAVGRQETPLGG